jgi:hypothetical protein
MDSFRRLCNSSCPGGFSTILTGHAYKTPTLSKVFDSNGKQTSQQADSLLRLCTNPEQAAQNKACRLHGSLCGSADDPNLQIIECSADYGECCKLVLDRMPVKGTHSFVGLVQLETSYNRRKMETNAFHLVSSQADFARGGKTHHHGGFSCYFGRHNAYRSYVDDFASRSTNGLDNKVSLYYLIYVVVLSMSLIGSCFLPAGLISKMVAIA